MARIRSIKPEFWGDFDTAVNLSRDARLLYISLWNFCDEHARMAGDTRYVKGHCFPYDDDLTPEVIDGLLDELVAAGNVVRYQVDRAPFLWLPNLHKHQRLEASKVPSRLPEPPDPDGPGHGADKSARDSDESETNVALQVAGSRLQAAGGRDAREARTTPPPQPVDNQLPGELAVLRSKLEARKLVVRWDKLTGEQVTEIIDLVNTHGDAPLVKAALAAFQPDDPIVFAQGWLKHWRNIRKPGSLSLVEPLCPVHSFQREPASSCKLCASERLAGDA